MRKVSVFTLQRNVGKQLEELPFKITKYGKVIAVVNKHNVTLNYPSIKLNEVIKNKGIDVCKHGARKGLCKYGCD